MFDDNQLVTIKWTNKHKKYYESKGYIFTGKNVPFEIHAKDLKPTSPTHVIVICDYCGEEYETTYASIYNDLKLSSKNACRHCIAKKKNETTYKQRAEKNLGIAKEYCNINGYTLLTTLNEYTDLKMKIRFICPIHGEQTAILYDFNRRKHMCPLCSREETRLSKDYVKNTIENVNGNILLNPDDYLNCSEYNLKIQCSCGNIYTTSFKQYTNENVTRCRKCSQRESSGELRIRTFLENNNIPFEQEKKFVDCCYINPLPFDFYLPENNIIIEFDGQQHFKPVFGNRIFDYTTKNDEIKNEYCLKNNIKLIRIPYWEGSKIEEIISKELNIAI